MRLAALAALATLAALAVVPAQATVAPKTVPPKAVAPTTVAPSRVQVSAKEFWFALSRKTVTNGPAIVELVNFGEDPHDLRLRRIGGTKVYRTPLIQPGAYFDLDVKLLPGRYKLWCSLPTHEARGMKATLVVSQR